MKRHRPLLVLAMLLSICAGSIALAQEPPTPPSNPPDVDITVQHEDSGFAVSPLWLAVGGAALLGLIAFIVAVSRRSDSGTTIVREQR